MWARWGEEKEEGGESGAKNKNERKTHGLILKSELVRVLFVLQFLRL